MKIKKVICFIDGFNLYHAIDDLNFDPVTRKPNFKKQHLKWLNLYSLASAFVHPKQEKLEAVYYFSAFAKWLPDPYNRHLDYVRALESVGVNVVMGNFKTKYASCKSCKAKWQTHEEKESDVNIALQLLHLAYEDKYDKAFLVTADTDLVPAVNLVKRVFPKKEVVALIPERRFGTALELRSACGQAIRIKEHNLERNLFSEKLTDGDEKVIERPEKYTPPKGWKAPT